ncbi:MAG: Aldehyde dehydrogenase [Deltaproteobacteria bacterium]|nr:Aldehyde dehydrogenase [Deltaproteobacteria bacterium]
MREYGLFVNGEWCKSAAGKTFMTKNPANGETLAFFAQGNRADVDRAAAAALRAFPDWKNFPPPKRGEILLRTAALLRRRKDELGEMVTKEMGKVLAEGKGDVQEAIDFFEYIAGEGRRLLGETTPSELPNKICLTLRQPIGVVGCITPWNFPIAVPSWKLGASLIAGNTIVFKPASLTPLCAATLIEVLEEAGLPPGVVNMVTGTAEEVGDAIVRHPKIRSISFTGGLAAGKDIYARAASMLKRVGLELGGKNPQIIMDDADIDLAVEGAIFGAFGTSGQRCTATSRLLVHERVYKEVKEKLLGRAKSLRIGDPLDPEVDVGPVASKEQERKILGFIKIGLKEGAKLLCGGNKMGGETHHKGYFISPTILETKHGMRISKEEIFGPVLSLIQVKGYEEAIHVANDVEYGLSSSIYTRDVSLAFRAMRDLEAGVTYINAPTIGAEVHLPFGGVKSTGNGTREAGTEAIHEFTEVKSVFVDFSGRLQKAQITES